MKYSTFKKGELFKGFIKIFPSIGYDENGFHSKLLCMILLFSKDVE